MTRDRILAGVVGALAAAVYAVVTLLRFQQVRLTSWDNAIFEQVVASYARLEAPISDVKAPGYNILGDHWSPINALIAPVYRLFPHAETLLLAQVVLIAVSVVVVTALAIRVAGRWRGVLIGLLYAFSFGLQAGVAADFHEVAWAVPLLALAGSAYVDGRYRAVVAWALPLLLVKEDLGATVALIGLALVLVGERHRGAWLAAGGVAGAALTLWVLIPAFGAGYAYTDQIGSGRSVVATLLDQADTKLVTLLLTFLIVGFAALLSPWALLVIPTFAWRFLGDNEFYWGTDWHYNLVLMPIVFVALLDAWKRHESRWLDVPLAVATIATVALLPGRPVAELLDPATYDDPPRAEAAREAVEAVPEGASVETDIGLITHLVSGRTTYWVGSITLGDEPVTPEYVAFDLGSGLGSPADPLAYAQDTYGGSWTTVFDRDGYVVLRGESST